MIGRRASAAVIITPDAQAAALMSALIPRRAKPTSPLWLVRTAPAVVLSP